jgi:hypothetical protein
MNKVLELFLWIDSKIIAKYFDLIDFMADIKYKFLYLRNNANGNKALL